MSRLAMSAESPRSSVFTFQSAVHSSHLLSCLDDQRRRDVLCDVTVVVEGRGFRAHRSVLASCSEYFTHRVSSSHLHGAVVTLPREVTVTGFEPLLKFAYTSKLLFSKDDVVEISHSATVLGFRDLDKACFDFVLPKFFSATKGSVPFQRWTCCRKKKRKKSQLPKADGDKDNDDNKKKKKSQPPGADGGQDNDDILEREKEAKPVSDSPAERDVVQTDNKSPKDERGSESGVLNPDLPPAAGAQSEGETDYSVRCPKYRKFQLACRKEACGTGTKLKCPVAVIEDDYISCLPRAGNCSSRNEPAIDGRGQRSPNPNRPGTAGTRAGEMEKEGRRGEVVNVIQRETDESEDEERGNMDAARREAVEPVTADAVCPETLGVRVGVSAGTSPGLPEEPLGLILHRCCPPASGEGCPLTGSVGCEALVKEVKEDREARVEESLSIHLQAEGRDVSERRRAHVEMNRDCRDRGRWVESDRDYRDRGREVERDRDCRDRGQGVERGNVETIVQDEERKTGGRRGSSVETEATRQPAEGLRSDTASPPALPRGPDSGAAASDPGAGEAKGPSLDWLKEHQLIRNARTSACPFLQELDPPRRGTETDTWGSKLSECEGASQAGKSPSCVSSLNSGEDGDSEDFDTGDTESPSERAKQVPLPFSADWMVSLSRHDFQQMLKQQQSLTLDQLSLVHDMRRRSKNRVAARRCRKRKLDCLYSLECEINKLRTEREKLVAEQSELNQMKRTTWHSVSALCQRVCREANLRPEQLQVLAKYTSLDCPLSTLVPYMDSLLAVAGPSCPSSGPADVYRTSSSESSDFFAGASGGTHR